MYGLEYLCSFLRYHFNILLEKLKNRIPKGRSVIFFRNIIIVNYKNRTKHINTLCGHNADCASACSYHSYLKGYVRRFRHYPRYLIYKKRWRWKGSIYEEHFACNIYQLPFFRKSSSTVLSFSHFSRNLFLLFSFKMHVCCPTLPLSSGAVWTFSLTAPNIKNMFLPERKFIIHLQSNALSPLRT